MKYIVVLGLFLLMAVPAFTQDLPPINDSWQRQQAFQAQQDYQKQIRQQRLHTTLHVLNVIRLHLQAGLRGYAESTPVYQTPAFTPAAMSNVQMPTYQAPEPPHYQPIHQLFGDGGKYDRHYGQNVQVSPYIRDGQQVQGYTRSYPGY